MAQDFWGPQPRKVGGLDASNWARLAEKMAGLGYWRLDVATHAISWSDGLFDLYGLEVGDLPNLEAAMAMIHPDDSAEANRLLDRAMRHGEDFTNKVRLRGADGSLRVVMCRGACRRAASGEVETVIGVVMDITEAEAAQEALRVNEARYRTLAENGQDLIVQSDLASHITYISPSAKAVTGYRPEELIGRAITEFIDPSDLAHLNSAIEHSIEHPDLGPACVEYRVRHKDGRVIWLQARPTPLVDPTTGQVIGVTDVVRDITERRALEAELLAKCEEAQAATRAKAEFLANMSHEIRTPLTAIIGFSGLLAISPRLSPVARGHVSKVRVACEQLLGVVNDVLDFSRLEAGQIELDPRPLSPAAFTAETLQLLSEQASAKGLALDFEVGAGVSEYVMADGGRLRQVLLNLAGNAVKFTASGAVVVALAAEDEKTLRFTVTDTGPGIAGDAQARLFERFSQADGSISRDHGGAGLGLSICKGLVELMGGAIVVRSAPGEGSSFSFSIIAPAADAPAPVNEAAASGTGPPARILVVDDLAVNRQLVRAMLEPLGHAVEEAASGEEALRMVARRRFDLILMDLQMPVMDGLETTRAIRAGPRANNRTPIVALSANVLAEHVTECARAGMNDHLAKPIVPASLVSMVGKWADGRRPARIAA